MKNLISPKRVTNQPKGYRIIQVITMLVDTARETDSFGLPFVDVVATLFELANEVFILTAQGHRPADDLAHHNRAPHAVSCPKQPGDAAHCRTASATPGVCVVRPAPVTGFGPIVSRR
jgi:hypothetical protein